MVLLGLYEANEEEEVDYELITLVGVRRSGIVLSKCRYPSGSADYCKGSSSELH